MENRPSLVLEGGGMRGLYTAGILDYFLETGLEFGSVYGASAGCLNGVNLVSRQKGRNLATFTDYQKDPNYRGIKCLIKTGNYFNPQFVYHDIPEKLNPFDYKTFDQSSTKLYAVVSNVESGKAEYILCNNNPDKLDYFQASASLPLISTIVEINGKKYLDGGVCDSIPLQKSITDGNEKNIVIMTRHKDYQKEPNKAMPLVRKMYKKYPAFIAAMEKRHIIYNKQTAFVSQMEKEGKAFILYPENPLEVGRLESDKEKLRALYNIGYQQAKKIYPQIMEYLNS